MRHLERDDGTEAVESRPTGISKILFGLLFIVGGLSGKLALIGTGSSGALVFVGVGFLAWGAYQWMKSQG
jgi:hypothetical protein